MNKKLRIMILSLLLISLIGANVQADTVEDLTLQLAELDDKIDELDVKIADLDAKILETTDQEAKSALITQREELITQRDELMTQRHDAQMELQKTEEAPIMAFDMQVEAKKCDPDKGLSNTVITQMTIGEEKELSRAGFDNVHIVKVLEREGDTVKFEFNGEQTGFVKEDELVSIAGLNLYVFEANYAPYALWLENPRVHFCFSERPEIKTAYKAEQQIEQLQKQIGETQKELEETKGMLAKIVEFLKKLFGFGE